MKNLMLGLLLCGVAWAQDFQEGKLTEIKTFSVANTSMLGRWAASDGGSAVIPATKQVISLTVTLGDITYTANFVAGKHLAPADFIVGDPIAARVTKDSVIIKRNDGKEARGYIVRKERITGLPSPPPVSR